MEKVINSYECLFIVDVTNGDEATDATVNKFTSLAEANAEIVDVAKWGKRRLAYPINDMPEGYYVVVTFKSAPEFPSELDRLFNIENTADVPEGKTYLDFLNPDSLTKLEGAVVEPSLADAKPGEGFQFVRTGYFCKDTKNPNTFNRVVGLKDSFPKN